MTPTSPSAVRAKAAELVTQVMRDGKSLDSLLMSGHQSPQERGLLRSLVYGTLRWYGRVDALLQTLASRPVDEMDPTLHSLLCVGLFQLFHTDIAPHAAVAETVEATRALKQPKAAGFVNAILRRAQREGAALLTQLDRDIAVRTAHPPWLVERLKKDWPAQFESILDANNAHPPMWLRVNSLRTTRDEYRQLLLAAGMASEVHPYASEALRLIDPVDVHALPHFDKGWVSVQDAAAQLAAHLLAPAPGDRVLDACAAPGGKTCHLLELQPKLSEVVALDHSFPRLRRVSENLGRLCLSAQVIEGDAAMPQQWWDRKPFNRILLDVPCSATGVIRRHPDIKHLRRPSDIDTLAQTQAQLLQAIWPLLAPGGRLLYASCSSLSAENAEVVSEFLAKQPNARDITAIVLNELSITPQSASPSSVGWPLAVGEHHQDGFYYACLEKQA